MRHILSLLALFILAQSVFSKPKADLSFPTESKSIHDVCISNHGKVVICTDDRKLKAFKIATKELVAEFNNGHTNKVLSVAMSPDSTLLVSGGRDSVVVIWDLHTQKILQRLQFVKGKICSLQFSPDSKFIAIGSTNSTVYIYSIEQNKCTQELGNQQKEFTSTAWSKYGNLLAVAGAKKTVNIYKTSDYSIAGRVAVSEKWIRSLAFYNDGRGLITCGDNGKTNKWIISNFKRIKSESTSKNGGWSMCLDIENENENNLNLYTVGTSKGKVEIYSIFKNYFVHVKSPINRVKIVPRNDHYIEIIVATLGKGLLKIQAKNLK